MLKSRQRCADFARRSLGHYVHSAPTPTAIDTGTVYITKRRVILKGSRQTRECAFAKLIGFSHDDYVGSTTSSVSNRQKPTTVRYAPQLSGASTSVLTSRTPGGAVGNLPLRKLALRTQLRSRRPLPRFDQSGNVVGCLRAEGKPVPASANGVRADVSRSGSARRYGRAVAGRRGVQNGSAFTFSALSMPEWAIVRLCVAVVASVLRLLMRRSRGYHR